jgi:hypothetical protein
MLETSSPSAFKVVRSGLSTTFAAGPAVVILSTAT